MGTELLDQHTEFAAPLTPEALTPEVIDQTIADLSEYLEANTTPEDREDLRVTQGPKRPTSWDAGEFLEN